MFGGKRLREGNEVLGIVVFGGYKARADQVADSCVLDLQSGLDGEFVDLVGKGMRIRPVPIPSPKKMFPALGVISAAGAAIAVTGLAPQFTVFLETNLGRILNPWRSYHTL